jgi:hypothetical protein
MLHASAGGPRCRAAVLLLTDDARAALKRLGQAGTP